MYFLQADLSPRTVSDSGWLWWETEKWGSQRSSRGSSSTPFRLLKVTLISFCTSFCIFKASLQKLLGASHFHCDCENKIKDHRNVLFQFYAILFQSTKDILSSAVDGWKVQIFPQRLFPVLYFWQIFFFINAYIINITWARIVMFAAGIFFTKNEIRFLS